MTTEFLQRLRRRTAELKKSGLFKAERLIESPQSARIRVGERDVLNFCANNYLGLANHPDVVEAAKKGLDDYGFGMASVRFICGTQTIHKELEERLSAYLGTEDTILYPSCFDANGGLFETLLGEKDAIVSDSLNHASIIDGIRLCKARRLRYQNNNMEDLESKLNDASSSHMRMIATDGVFSMDGSIAKMNRICELAESSGSLVMMDDCHATGFLGDTGKGTHEYHNVMDKVDLITGTLGKALGGGAGGYTSGRKELISWLRQRSRPYLFSNTLAPPLVAAALKVMDLLEQGDNLRVKLHENSRYFREGMEKAGFNLLPGEHPIIPVMLGDASLATKMADSLLERGIYVVGFAYPVVPEGQARIRTQMSAAHDREHLDEAIAAFTEVGEELGVIGGEK
ncbi:MAG: glycine C-acetyltransferase [Gammaproteobacteria bacterium]